MLVGMKEAEPNLHYQTVRLSLIKSFNKLAGSFLLGLGCSSKWEFNTNDLVPLSRYR
jgi:gamma-glutamylcysteine synthetase